MVRALSRSVFIMFLFDLILISVSTSFWCEFFNIPDSITMFILFSTVITGIITVFLKGHYKIREFNINRKNSYLLFEGMLFTNIPAAIILFLFLRNMNSIYFLSANIMTIYFSLFI